MCERTELLASLEESLQIRVTLIVAPAGFGKTTLLAQWCERLTSQHIAAAYYAASKRDRDVTVFLAMIASALGAAGIDMGERPAFEQGKIRDDLSLDDILLPLELAGQPVILIVDEYEHLDDPAITKLVIEMIEAAPPTVHFVFASRSLPAIPLSALEIEGRLRLIDAYQLRLRREELAWMLELDAEAPELKEFAVRSQGWPVTAELYRLWRKRHRSHDARATFGGHVAEVQAYLTEQLFSSLPAEQLSLLVDISDREEISPDLGDAMRDRQDSASLLTSAARAISSLMWTGQDHGSTVYRLHPLLLEHLRQTLSQDAGRRMRLATNAARWYFARRRYPEAVRTAVESRDQSTIDHIVRALRPVHILVADGATTLRLVLRELPDDLIARHPRLQIMAVAAHFKAGFFAESRNMIGRIRDATHGFTEDPDGHPDWLTVEGNLMDLIVLCQVSRCPPQVEELYARMIEAAADDPIVWGAGEIVKMLVWQVRGDFDAADEAILRARAIYNTVELSRYGHTQIVGHEVLILTARGRLRPALEVITSYQKQPGFEVPDDISTPILLRLILAVIRYEQEFSDAAVDALRNAFVEHSRHESWFDQYAIAYPVIAMRLAAREGIDTALQYIVDAEARAQRTGIEALPDFLAFLEIEFRVRGGDVANAARLAEAVGLVDCAALGCQLVHQRGWRERDAALHALIRLRLGEGRPEEALVAANQLARAAQVGGRLRTEIKGLVFEALIYRALVDAEAATDSMLRAVLLAYPEGFVAPFAEEGQAVVDTIVALAAEPTIDAFARRHLADIRRAINTSMARPQADQLNAREREIVGHLAEGLPNKVIARRMGITDHTVKFHLKKVFSKLEVSSRRAAVAKVQASGIDD